MGNRRVLIIDDDQGIWKAYQSVLAPKQEAVDSSLGKISRLLDDNTGSAPIAGTDFHLRFASQGEEGFDLIRESLAHTMPFAVIFIDIRMPPGWNGMETAVQIRRIDPNVEIVIVTAYSDYSQFEIVREIGAPDKLLILLKPFDPVEIAQLTLSLTEKWNLTRKTELQAAELISANKRLRNDITKRKQAEEALLQNERKYRSLVEITSDWIWEVDQNGVYTYSSQKVKDIMGYEPKDIIGKKPFDFMPATEAKRVAELFMEISASMKPFAELVNTNIHKDGQDVILETSGVPIINAEGILLGYRGIDRDITERKDAEERLRINEKILNNAQEIAHIGSWHLDIQKNILSWSDETYRIFGLPPLEFGATYEAFLEMIHPDDREMVDRTYADSIKNNIPYECVHRVVHPDGTVRIVQEKSEDIVDESGKTIHSFGMTHDITELKQAEEEREKLIKSLQTALSEIKTLRGIIPICASCKKIRDDTGYWKKIETYIEEHSDAEFSHGVCQECCKKLYPNFVDENGNFLP